MPIGHRMSNGSYTTSIPTPRYRIAWLGSTKCAVGAASIIACTNRDIRARGVVPPSPMLRKLGSHPRQMASRSRRGNLA